MNGSSMKWPESEGTRIFNEFFQKFHQYEFLEDLSSKPNRFRTAKINTKSGIKFLKLSVNSQFNDSINREIQVLKNSYIIELLKNRLNLPNIIIDDVFKEKSGITFGFFIRDYLEATNICNKKDLIMPLINAYYEIMNDLQKNNDLQKQVYEKSKHYSLESVLNEMENDWMAKFDKDSKDGGISGWKDSEPGKKVRNMLQKLKNMQLKDDWSKSTSLIFRDIYCSHIFVKDSQLYLIDIEMTATGSVFIDFGHLFFSYEKTNLNNEIKKAIKNRFQKNIKNWEGLLNIGILYKCFGQLHHQGYADKKALSDKEIRITSIDDIKSNEEASKCVEIILSL